MSCVYTHFVALKLLRCCLARDPAHWAAHDNDSSSNSSSNGDEGQQLLCFLLTYANRLGDAAVYAHAWRPVTAELCTTIAVLLKLRAVCRQRDSDGNNNTAVMTGTSSSGSNDDADAVQPARVAAVVNAVLSWLLLREEQQQQQQQPLYDGTVHGCMAAAAAAWPPVHVYVRRLLCASLVEELGVYTTASRYRGVPLRVHSACRAAVEHGGLLSRIVYALLLSLCNNSSSAAVSLPMTTETRDTLDAGLTALVTCLSWPAHRYVDDDAATTTAATDDACEVYAVGDGSWDTLLLSPQLFTATTTTTTAPAVHDSCGGGGVVSCGIFALLQQWCMQGRIAATALPRRTPLAEALQLLCAMRGERWPVAQLLWFVHTALRTCVELLEYVCHTTSTQQQQQQPSCDDGDAEALLQLLPLLSSAVRRLVSNNLEHVVQQEAVMLSLLERLARVTHHIILCEAAVTATTTTAAAAAAAVCVVADAQRDSVCACLEELLRTWYALAAHMERSSSSSSSNARQGNAAPATMTSALAVGGEEETIRRSCAALFQCYVQAKTTTTMTHNNNNDDDDGSDSGEFAVSFALSQLQLMAHIGRVASSTACAVLATRLLDVARTLEHAMLTSQQQQQQQQQQSLSSTTAARVPHDGGSAVAAVAACYEPLWVLLKLTQSFIADASDGEQACMPRCFADAALHSDAQLVQLMTAVLSLQNVLLYCGGGGGGNNNNNNNSNSSATVMVLVSSPAVFAAYADVLTAYMRTYMTADGEDDNEGDSNDNNRSGGGGVMGSCAAQQQQQYNNNNNYSNSSARGGGGCSSAAAALYARALDHGVAVVHTALHLAATALSRFAYEDDVTTAVCALLDVLADRSAAVRAYATTTTTQPSVCETLARYAYDVQQYRFAGHTRGRLLAFLVTCNAAAAAAAATTRGQQQQQQHSVDAVVHEVLQRVPFDALAAECDAAGAGAALPSSSLLSAEMVQELLSALAGLLESLRQQDVLRATAPLLMRSVRGALLACRRRLFHERDCAIELVQCVTAAFTTCASLLEDAAVCALLALVVEVLHFATASLASSSTWWQDGAAGEDDRARLLVATARLTTAAAQWKLLDCFLPDEDTAPLAVAAVDALARLLGYVDGATLLRLPAVEEAAFAALELSAEAFTRAFVFCPHARNLFAALLYALSSDSATVQRIGGVVTTRVALCLEHEAATATTVATDNNNNNSSSCSNGDGGYASVCAELLRALLRALVSGAVCAGNTHAIAKALLVVARGVNGNNNNNSETTLHAVFAHVAAEATARDGADAAMFLHAVYTSLCGVLSHTHAHAAHATTATLPVTRTAATPRGVAASNATPAALLSRLEAQLQESMAALRGARVV